MVQGWLWPCPKWSWCFLFLLSPPQMQRLSNGVNLVISKNIKSDLRGHRKDPVTGPHGRQSSDRYPSSSSNMSLRTRIVVDDKDFRHSLSSQSVPNSVEVLGKLRRFFWTDRHIHRIFFIFQDSDESKWWAVIKGKFLHIPFDNLDQFLDII